MLKKTFSWIWKKKWRTLCILILCGICFFWIKNKYFSSNTPEIFTSYDYTVETGTVSNSLSLVGTTQFANAQKLTFANKGRVTAVNTKVGASVKKGDVLATITTDDLDRSIQNERKNLKNQQLKLNNLLDKANKDLDILKAQSTYDLLLLQKENLPSDQYLELQTKKSKIQDYENQIKDKEKELKEAKNDYNDLVLGKAGATNAELALSENVRNRNNTFDKLIRGFRDNAIELQSTIDSYDQLMKMTSNYSSESSNVYIGAKNQTAVNESKKQFWVVEAYINKLNTLYSDFSKKELGQITENELLDGYAIFKELGNEMISWGKTNYDMFYDSIESQGSLSKSDINSYTKTYGTAVEKAGYDYLDKYTDAVEQLAKIKNSDTTIEDAENKVEKLGIELEQLKISLQKANNELEIAKTQQVLDSAELDKKIQDAKIDLQKAKEGNAQEQEIDSIRNEIDNIQFSISTYLKKYDEYKIIANFDGVVTKLDMQVGDSIEMNNTSSSDQKYIYVETPDLLEVDLSIDQIDIVKVNTGMPVEVYLDAFPDTVYTGVFSEIDTMPENGGDFGSNGSYKAKVVFQKHDENERILGGMSASIKVVLNEEKDVLVIPNPSIVDNEIGEKIVRLQKSNGEWIDKVVELGLSDEVNTVVLSGLKAGDIIKGLYITDNAITNAGINDEEESFR